MIKSPCFNCIEREFGCQSKCEKNKEFLEAHALEKEKIRKAKMENEVYMTYKETTRRKRK